MSPFFSHVLSYCFSSPSWSSSSSFNWTFLSPRIWCPCSPLSPHCRCIAPLHCWKPAGNLLLWELPLLLTYKEPLVKKLTSLVLHHPLPDSAYRVYMMAPCMLLGQSQGCCPGSAWRWCSLFTVPQPPVCTCFSALWFLFHKHLQHVRQGFPSLCPHLHHQCHPWRRDAVCRRSQAWFVSLVTDASYQNVFFKGWRRWRKDPFQALWVRWLAC